MWQPLRRGCFERFNLFSLDLPWNGEDGYYWCHARPAHEWLQLTLELLPQEPSILVAHSYGVNVLLEYLQRAPMPDLAALVLMSTFFRADETVDDWILFRESLRGFRAIFEEGITLRRGKALEASLLSSMVDKVLEHIGPVGFMECFSHYIRTPSLELSRINVPALVLAGERDPGATASSNAALAARLPSARFASFPHCGHFCMLERPDLVEQTVREFLARVST
jgi:pimeloyl-ACP methyl ester carboxylesterase